MRHFDTDLVEREGSAHERDWIDRLLPQIHAHLPAMRRRHADQASFWRWFSAEADALGRHVEDHEARLYYRDRINALLEDAGIEERL